MQQQAHTTWALIHLRQQSWLTRSGNFYSTRMTAQYSISIFEPRQLPLVFRASLMRLANFPCRQCNNGSGICPVIDHHQRCGCHALEWGELISTRSDLVSLRGEHVPAVSRYITTLHMNLTVSFVSYRDSSFGWNPEIKRKELFHSLSRFIIVRGHKDTLLAFLMFRFDHEYDQDIIYWYWLSYSLRNDARSDVETGQRME